MADVSPKRSEHYQAPVPVDTPPIIDEFIPPPRQAPTTTVPAASIFSDDDFPPLPPSPAPLTPYPEPKTLAAVLRDPNWNNAMKHEKNNMEITHTWDLAQSSINGNKGTKLVTPKGGLRTAHTAKEIQLPNRYEALGLCAVTC
ncbi:hypothetical protein YC2023_004684 [Brassica napus]